VTLFSSPNCWNQVAEDGTFVLFCGERFRWSDISVSLKNMSLRVRFFLLDPAIGSEHVVAATSIPLPSVDNHTVASPFQAPTPSARSTGSGPDQTLGEGEVVAWCELSKVHSSTGAATVHIGETWGVPSSSWAIKFRARVKHPKKHKRARKNSMASSVGTPKESSRNFFTENDDNMVKNPLSPRGYSNPRDELKQDFS
jgi:hypothetical protein